MAQSLEGQRVPTTNGIAQAPRLKSTKQHVVVFTMRSVCATAAPARGTWLPCSDARIAELSKGEQTRSDFARNRKYIKKGPRYAWGTTLTANWPTTCIPCSRHACDMLGLR